MGLSNYTHQAILNAVFGKTSNFGALASVPTFYVGASSTTPNKDGTNVTEPTAGAYARVSTAPADWDNSTLADPAVLDNLNTVTFPTATADWLSAANITDFVVYDALTVGNFLGFGTLTVAQPVLDTNTLTFTAGNLSWTLG